MKSSPFARFSGRASARAHDRITVRCAMAHGDDITASDENMRLADRDTALHHLRGARDDEQIVWKLLKLGKLMRLGGVLNRERMQGELAPEPFEKVERRFVKSDPHDMTVARRPFSRSINIDVGDFDAVLIDDGVDDALGSMARRRAEGHLRAPAISPWGRRA